MEAVVVSDDKHDELRLARQRKRSLAIALALVALVLMFYAATLIQFGKILGQ